MKIVRPIYSLPVDAAAGRGVVVLEVVAGVVDDAEVLAHLGGGDLFLPLDRVLEDQVAVHKLAPAVAKVLE